IPEKCRHLLYALYFGSQYGEDIADLRLAYQSLHPHLCAKYGQSHDPKDFEESLRILEGGFIRIQGYSVSFVNPSFRDYLTAYLDDLEQLKDFAAIARQADWARQLWSHGEKIAGKTACAGFALAFKAIARELMRIPTWKKSAQYPHTYDVADLSNTDRIDLLIRWWEASGDEEFARLATNLAAKPVGGFSSMRDGTDLIELIGNFKNEGYYCGFPFNEEMVSALEDGILAVLNGGVDSDDIERISNAVAGAEETLGPDIVAAANAAIQQEFDGIERMVADT